MYEVYAIIASLLLPTGLIGVIYFLYYLKYSNHRSLWTFIFENIATIFLGIFYLYSAVILSQTYATNELDWFDNNIDDLAIVNETTLERDAEPFYPTEPEVHNNEIEDTRNSKNRGTSNDFLRAYQSLVWSSIRKTLQNGTREQRSLYRNIFNYARGLNDNTTDILENQDCFLRTFLYQALLVYSFISSALSLINTCQICSQCTELNPEAIPRTPQQTPNETTKQSTESQNISETFGEKIVDAPDDSSSQNEAPVGPLFEADSIDGSSTNLEVFLVKKLSQVNLTNEPGVGSSCKAVEMLQQESPFVIAGKCVTIIILPVVLVLILYVLMDMTVAKNLMERDTFDLNSLPNFNDTNASMQTENLFKELNPHNAAELEMSLILRNVYKVINNFQENHKNTKIPLVTGHYLSKLKTFNSTKNLTKECVGNEPNLKTFDFTVFVLAFFAVLFYVKTSEMKLSKTKSTSQLNKCTWAFLMMWVPGIIEILVSRVLTTREPNIISTLLLLLGNLDRLYSTKQNIDIYKIYGKAKMFVNPIPQ